MKSYKCVICERSYPYKLNADNCDCQYDAGMWAEDHPEEAAPEMSPWEADRYETSKLFPETWCVEYIATNKHGEEYVKTVKFDDFNQAEDLVDKLTDENAECVKMYQV